MTSPRQTHNTTNFSLNRRVIALSEQQNLSAYCWTVLVVMVRRCVEAIPRGHTSFEERFPGKRRRIDEGLPPLAPWRSNLVSPSLSWPTIKSSLWLTNNADCAFSRAQSLFHCLRCRHLCLRTGIPRAEHPPPCAHPSLTTFISRPDWPHRS